MGHSRCSIDAHFMDTIHRHQWRGGGEGNDRGHKQTHRQRLTHKEPAWLPGLPDVALGLGEFRKIEAGCFLQWEEPPFPR